MDFKDLRRDYWNQELNPTQLKDNPFDQFLHWLSQAVEANILEPNALSLATVSPEGKPVCRTVLMKDFNDQGLVFYTNYTSRKAKHIDSTPYVGVTFLWKELDRQVNIEGKVEKVSLQEASTYFAARPRGSQLSAWASPQSEIIPSRKFLDDIYSQLEHEYKGKDIPLPPFWGGFRIKPARFEFWQGQHNRLHDRFCYVLEGDMWKIYRLAP